jgi:M6 family metalloprotease-like protein
VETARDHRWAINFTKQEKDTIHIIAVRVQFQPGSSELTTGNGLFGIQGDPDERRRYAQGEYRFDNLPHDSLYFVYQLTALKNYYNKVSRGNLTLEFTVYPSGSGETGYSVPHQMTHYSPGWRRREESVDAYWDRKTHGLMMFVRDALQTASRGADGIGTDSPFRNLYRDDNGILRDAQNGHKKAAILIFHAGASYLTDGGMTGSPNSPSDMIDAFINQEFFKYFQNALELDTTGIRVTGHEGRQVTITETMMSSETSNQDGLNWGIQGILVNQMARQLGIPDLFSTSSGISAIGAFCIMDFAGYSAGQGFIPPYPSAWVRAFMGWDTPHVVGAGNSYRVKALTSVLNRENSQTLDDDTTIVLIPINSNEFYLIENRQRNLSSDPSRFNYDAGGNTIKSYPLNVNIENNVTRLSSTSGVILETENNDISLPASGLLVWHVDERVIRQKLAHNFVNVDSSYRGVRLVEADGINDLGVTFIDAFYQAMFDYGGAEDVFPHRTIRDGKITADVRGFGPYTRPSTRANDGGHSYLNIDFTPSSAAPREERTLNFQDDMVINYSDSVFLIDVRYDHIASGWPRRVAPEQPGMFYDPLITEIAVSSPTSTDRDTVLVLLGESGRLYLFSINGNKQESHGDRSVNIELKDYHGKPINSSISVRYFDDIPGAFTFPTAIGGRIYIPSTQSNQHVLYVYNSLNIGNRETITLPAAPSSYVCGIDDETWAVGLTDGRIVVGSNNSISDTISLNSPRRRNSNNSSSSPTRADSSLLRVSAIAILKDADAGQSFIAIQDNGKLSVIRNMQIVNTTTVRNGIPPFTLTTGDLDNNGKSEIVVSDSRQGLWVYTRELNLASGWSDIPNDWASTYHDPGKRHNRDRRDFPENFSAPALADLNRDGNLDIIISGTNGIYALNRRGALLSRWPAYLDNRYWYQRGSVTTSPIVVSANRNDPLVLFASPTGENATFNITKIETADKERGVITFRRDDGRLDSLWDLSASFIDTVLTIGDSLIYPYVLPGGFIDALTANAARPLSQIGSWAIPQSRWPVSIGAPAASSPIVYRTAPNAVPSLFAVASDITEGWVYKWQLTDLISDTLYWPQTGFNAARTFAYGGPVTETSDIITIQQPIIFWNYPNPTLKDDQYTTFKYQFNGRAENVRLDIHTITGYRMDTFHNLSGDFPGWNEFRVNLRKYGPGIYRCRMEATINGRRYSRMWKMAVVK